MDAEVWVPIMVATIGVTGVIVGVMVNDRRESRKSAQVAVERTESEMERVLRERIKLRDEQLAELRKENVVLRQRIDDLVKRLDAGGDRRERPRP